MYIPKLAHSVRIQACFCGLLQGKDCHVLTMWCIFLSISQVTNGNRTKHYVSYRRNEFVQMKFPKYALPKVKHKLVLLLIRLPVKLWVFANALFN